MEKNEQSEKEQKASRLWLPVLLMGLAWPFLRFVASNGPQLSGQSLLFMVILFFIALALFLVSTLWLSRQNKVAVLSTACFSAVGVNLFFLFGPLQRMFQNSGTPSLVYLGSNEGYLLIFYGLFGIMALLITATALTSAAIRKVLSVFILTGAAMALVSAMLKTPEIHRQLSSPPRSVSADEPAITERFEVERNVYHIVMDSYGRSDLLQTELDWDNSGFLDELRTEGFAVAEQSTAPYPTSYLSISSILKMDYVVLPGTDFDDIMYFVNLMRDKNTTYTRFKESGYSLIRSGNIGWGTTCSGVEDLCLNEVSTLSFFFQEAAYVFLSETPLQIMYNRLLHPNAGNLDDIEARLPQMFDYSPFYLFAHSFPPHPPHRLSADCSHRPADGSLREGGTKDAYIEELQCVNQQALSLVRSIKEMDPDSIIVLQSDHGPIFSADFAEALEDWTERQVMQRLANLTAIYAPQACLRHFQSDMNAVNTLPFIFACLKGEKEPDYLDSRVFWGTYRWFSDYGRVIEVSPP